MPARASRPNRDGIRQATCATSSKPFASAPRKEISHGAVLPPPWRDRRSPDLWGGERRAGLLQPSERNRDFEARTQPRGRHQQLHGMSLLRLHQYTTTGAKVQKGFLAG